ncbi:MAG TPA: FlgD immunoglobulin-like domain containing protein, partial [bacterium]|nr:FlgD immunoglobulin-like domain containing protein [bacterium]
FRRVTATQILLVLPGTRLQEPAGIAVTRLAATDDPHDNSDDDEVTIVAVDGGAGRIFTNFGLAKLGTWDGEGSEVGRLRAPSDVAIDRGGTVAVTDTGNRRVVLLRHDGASLGEERAVTGFAEPIGIAADGAGGFYVCDRTRGTVTRLDAETGARVPFGLETGFDRPVHVAAVPEGDDLARGKEPAVVVVDRDGQRVRSFDSSGVLRASLDSGSLASPNARFGAVEIDYYGNVYALDRTADRLHKLRDDLVHLDTFGRDGTNPGEFRGPRGIAIHRRLGQVFITEEDGGQYLWVGTDVRGFRADPRPGAVDFSFTLTEHSQVTMRILDAQGREVAVVVPERRVACGPQHGVWEGRTTDGRPAPPGRYLAEIRARATYSSGSRFEKKLLEPFTLAPASEPR